jgi:hypothetical protein
LLTHIAEHGADDVHLCISTCEALPQFFITLDKEFRRLLGTTSKSPFKYLTFREWSTLIGASGFEIIRHERLTLPHLIVASEEFLRHWEAASTKAAYYGRSWDALEPEVRDDLMTMLRERFGTNGTSFWRFDEETLFFIASRRD